MNIYDIAKLSGVSIATVSRVVNGSPLVSEKTKAHVLRIMEENNYTPNVFARGLNLNSMKTVGLVCPDVADNYMARAVSFLEQDLRQYGYDCILYCSGHADEGRKAAVDTLLQKRIDALVIIGSSYARDDVASAETDYIREAAKQVPVFLMNGYIQGENIYCALCNDYEASFHAVFQMLSSGRKKILFLSDSHSFSANQKRKGYEAALEKAGIPVSKEFEIYVENQIDKVRDMLEACGSLSFDGVFATEDGLAAGALKYKKKKGLSAPVDVAIIGYNNSELSVCCDPELSSIDSRVERLCKIIIDSMMLLFGGKKIPDKVYAKGSLVRRATTDF